MAAMERGSVRMTGRIVHIECGKPPSQCDCPASVKRPLRCVIEQIHRADKPTDDAA